MKSAIIYIFLVSFGFNCHAKKLPAYINKCTLSDPVQKVSKCITENMMNLFPKMGNGIPEMKLPPIEPFHIPKIEVEGTNGGFSISFSNINVSGIKDTVIKDFTYDKDKPYMGLYAYAPHLYVRANYKIKGKLLLFELDSTGIGYMNISDTEIKSHHRKMSFVTRNGNHYLVLDDDEIESVTYKNGALYLNDIFKNNQQLTEQVNEAINNNFEEITKDLNPLIYEAVRLIFLGVLKPIFNEFSLEDLFV